MVVPSCREQMLILMLRMRRIVSTDRSISGTSSSHSCSGVTTMATSMTIYSTLPRPSQTRQTLWWCATMCWRTWGSFSPTSLSSSLTSLHSWWASFRTSLAASQLLWASTRTYQLLLRMVTWSLSSSRWVEQCESCSISNHLNPQYMVHLNRAATWCTLSDLKRRRICHIYCKIPTVTTFYSRLSAIKTSQKSPVTFRYSLSTGWFLSWEVLWMARVHLKQITWPCARVDWLKNGTATQRKCGTRHFKVTLSRQAGLSLMLFTTLTPSP